MWLPAWSPLFFTGLSPPWGSEDSLKSVAGCYSESQTSRGSHHVQTKSQLISMLSAVSPCNFRCPGCPSGGGGGFTLKHPLLTRLLSKQKSATLISSLHRVLAQTPPPCCLPHPAPVFNTLWSALTTMISLLPLAYFPIHFPQCFLLARKTMVGVPVYDPIAYTRGNSKLACSVHNPFHHRLPCTLTGTW